MKIKKYYLIMSLMLIKLVIVPYVRASCQSPGPAIKSESCLIQGLNENPDGTLDSSVKITIYGMGHFQVFGLNFPTSACNEELNNTDECIRDSTGGDLIGPVDLRPNSGITCGAGLAHFNGNWDQFIAQGCESSITSDDGSASAVTVFVGEQLSSSSGLPQYLVVAVGQNDNKDSFAYDYDYPNALRPRSFQDFSRADITNVEVVGSNVNITFTWNGSRYYNNGDSGGVNVKPNECDMNSDGTKDTCVDFIYGYRTAYQTTNCVDHDNNPSTPCVCQNPTGFDISSGWTVDNSTILYPDDGSPTCLSDDPQPCTATISIPQSTCNTSTGANCCAVVGFVHVYKRGDNNLSNPNDGLFNGWYTRGTFDATTNQWEFARLATGGVLGADVKNFRASLVETGRFTSVARIQWESVVEDGVLGYHVWRSCDASGRFQRVTSSMIPTTGQPGTTYSYDDSPLICFKNGVAYYKLEIVRGNGISDFHNEVISFSTKDLPIMPPGKTDEKTNPTGQVDSGRVAPPTPKPVEKGTVNTNQNDDVKQKDNAPQSSQPPAKQPLERPETITGILGTFEGRLSFSNRWPMARITWTAQDETNVVGYHVWRACSPDNRWVRVTGVPIRASGKAGSLYTFTDRRLNCPVGQNAMYRIEILRRSGGSVYHPQIVTLLVKRENR